MTVGGGRKSDTKDSGKGALPAPAANALRCVWSNFIRLWQTAEFATAGGGRAPSENNSQITRYTAAANFISTHHLCRNNYLKKEVIVQLGILQALHRAVHLYRAPPLNYSHALRPRLKCYLSSDPDCKNGDRII